MKMRKFFTKVLFALTSVVVFTSCENDNEEISSQKELSITTSWAGTPETKAIKTVFNSSDEMGLFVTSGDLSGLYNDKAEYGNVSSIWGGSSWSQKTNIYLDNKEATIYAYYPYSLSAGNGKTISVETISQTDYMFGKSQTKANIATPSANIEMKHALAQVAFKISTENYSGNGILQQVSISNAGAGNTVYTKGLLNCQTGEVTGTEVGTLTLSANTTLSSSVSVFTAITMPVQTPITSKTIQLTFKIDGINYTYALAAGTAWMPGTKNVYTIILKGKNIVIGGDSSYGQDGVDIKDWNEVINGEIELTPVV